MPLTPGTQVAGLLEIGEMLPELVGAPMCGRVHRATELDSGREQWVVAIGPEFTPTDTKRGELAAAAKQAGKLGGPGVLAPGLVVAERGETIVGHVPPPGALGFALSGLWGDADAVIPLAVELAYALARIHAAGTVHGAFSLGSVCVADGHAWTWQQGLAQAFEPGALAAQARKLRSRQPFPPEFLAFGGRPTTGTDVYAWGVTVTQMISGRPDDAAAKDIASGLGGLDSDHPLVRVLKSCLNENASARPRDAQEVVARLEGEGYSAPAPSSFADSGSSGTAPIASGKKARSAKRTIFSPGSLPTPAGGPGGGGGGLPPPPSHGRLGGGGLPPPPSHPADDFPAPELAQGVPGRDKAPPPPPPPRPPKAPPKAPPPQRRVAPGAPTMMPGHAPPPYQHPGHPPPGPGMDPTMVPGMGGPQYPHPGPYGPPPGYGPGPGMPPGPGYGPPGAQHVPAVAPAAVGAMEDFAASLDRAIALETGDTVGLSGGPASGGDSGVYEPGRVDLRPGESAEGELALDRAIERLDGAAAPGAIAPSISGPMLDDDDPDALPEPGVAPVVHTESKPANLPRKPGPHGWESRGLSLVAVFLPLFLLGAAVAFLGPEAGGFDVFAGLAPRDGDPEKEKYAPIEEKDYSIPDFGSGVVADLPEIKKKCEYGTAIIDGDVCIDQGESPGLGQLPTTSVTYEEAQATCAAKDARLCTKDEFKRACMGKKGTRFPYGDFFKDYCNVADGVNLPRVRASGASGKCRSEIGTYDQVGNVGEWIEGGEVMGGDVRTNGQSALCKSRGKPPKGFKGEFVGFRCCYDRE